MNAETHSQLANFIWSICNLLRGPYKRNEYRKVILPLTVLRRFDCLLAPTKAQVLASTRRSRPSPRTVVRSLLEKITGRPFYNLSKLDLPKLLDDPNQLAPNLNAYINGFSKNVREIMERFAFDQQIARMAEKNLLYEVIKAFCDPKIDLSSRSPRRQHPDGLRLRGADPDRRRAVERGGRRALHAARGDQADGQPPALAGDRTCARATSSRPSTTRPAAPAACSRWPRTYIRELNAEANPHLFGQDWNDESWAICKSDMLIKGEDADNIVLGDTFTKDGFDRDAEGKKRTFDYMLANPPFGVEWKQQQKYIEHEARTARLQRPLRRRAAAHQRRLAALPAAHALEDARARGGGSRIAIVFNGSPLFTGDAGSGESNIRQWIIENDWLEAVVALPDQLFYNTGISTYIWVLTNRKEPQRKGKIQLIDARRFFVKMKKSLGNKRNKIGDPPTSRASPTRSPTSRGSSATSTTARRGPSPRKTRSRSSRSSASVSSARSSTTPTSASTRSPSSGRCGSTSRRAPSASRGWRTRAASRSSPPATRRTRRRASKRSRPASAGRRRSGSSSPRSPRRTARRSTRTARPSSPICARSTAHAGVRLTAPEIKAVLGALGERDETAEICRDRDGNPEPDPELRDTESVPLKESIDEYFKREVLPHVPDAWIDESKTKVGYEIPLNRHFYRYEPPRPLEVIEADIKTLEGEILALLKDVTA